MLKAGIMVKCKDLNDYVKEQTKRLDDKVGVSPKLEISCGVFLVCSLHYIPNIVQGRMFNELATESWAP